MKKLLMFFLIIVNVLAFCSCDFSHSDEKDPPNGNGQNGDVGETPDGGNEGTTPVDEDVIFGPGVETNIVKTKEEVGDYYTIADDIFAVTGKLAVIIYDDTEPTSHEIVIGETSRAISARAIAKMKQGIEDDEGKDGIRSYYCLYSDGRSLAIVWSDDYGREAALDFFRENYFMSEKLKLDKGHLVVTSFSKIDAMREEEMAERAEKYAQIEENYGKGVVDALKNHLSIYDDRFYLWLADLYDPGEYDSEGNPVGGGFYYSNSARNTPGYLIDIESTSQALSFLTSSGMLRGYGNDYMKAIPEKMQKEMVAFALSLQSPVDGYFYHPQWGTDITAGRLSRDMGNSVSVLKRFGEVPYWNTPGGAKGSRGDPPGAIGTKHLTDRLSGESTVSAVSKVTPTASSVWPQRLKTLQNWKDYIDSFDELMETQSYSIGHNVAEQAAQIKNREAEAIKNGEPIGYIEYTRLFFDRHQNPENGLWEDEVSYNSVNGLMKIMAIYNNLDLELNYAQKAYNSAVEIITLEGKDVNGKEATNSVDVYNAWCSLVRINTNIKQFGSKETVDALREDLLRDAERLIRITTEKTKKFVKEDGSFGYTWNYSPAKSQGAPAAVPNTVEGDVNGGTIAIIGVTENMLSALGISGLYVYYPSDFEIFIDRVAGLSAVVKDEIEPPSNEYDFEDEEVGEQNPSGVAVELTDGSFDIVNCDGKNGSTNAIRLKTVKDKGDRFYLKPYGIAENQSCYILQFDIKLESVSANTSTAMQIKLGNMYMLTLGVKTNGTLTFGDSSATDSSAITNSFSGAFDGFAWHTVRIEFYNGDKFKTRVTVDGECLAVSDNYFGAQKGESITPKYDNANFYALFSTNLTALFDNIVMDCSSGKLEGDTTTEEIKPYDGTTDFEDAELGEVSLPGITVTPNPEEGNSITVALDPKDSENKALKITAKSSTKAGNWVIASAPDSSEGVAVFEADIYAAVLNRAGDIAQIFFNSGSGTVFALNMKLIKCDGGHTLTFGEKNSDNSRSEIFARHDDTIDDWFRLRIEYDPASFTASVYVNGSLLGRTDAYYSEANKSSELATVSFYTTFSTDAEIYIDNLTVSK